MLIIEGHPIRNYSEQMTDEEFFEFCLENKELRIERDKNKNILIMSPITAKTGNHEGRLTAALFDWTDNNNGVAFGPNVGFYLPNTAMRAPDAAWMSEEKWSSFSEEEKEKFLYGVPDFIIEVRSPSDHPNVLEKKMEEWIENGVLLAWMVDPLSKKAIIYRKDGSMKILEDFKQKISGENILKGFEFELSKLLTS